MDKISGPDGMKNKQCEMELEIQTYLSNLLYILLEKAFWCTQNQ